jgi:hypothetical protein
MGPKKAAPAKKKGDGGAADGSVALTPEEQANMFRLTCQALQVQLGR